jgi:hypothetical protein
MVERPKDCHAPCWRKIALVLGKQDAKAADSWYAPELFYDGVLERVVFEVGKDIVGMG